MSVTRPADRVTQPGSSFTDLRLLLDNSLVVRHVAVRLEQCKAGDKATAIRLHMERMSFDVMGVQENGVLRGYVRRADLKSGRCGDHSKPFAPQDIISSATPLAEVLPLLRSRPHLFVLDRAELDGLVTRADLQKAPVRMLLFGLVSLLEASLTAMVRICFLDGSFESRLSPGRQQKAGQLFAERRGRNEEIDLADCLKLADKLGLLAGVPDFLSFFGLPEARSARKQFEAMEALRNRLAHGQDLVTGTTWEAVIGTALAIDDFLGRYDRDQAVFARRFRGAAGKS